MKLSKSLFIGIISASLLVQTTPALAKSTPHKKIVVVKKAVVAKKKVSPIVVSAPKPQNNVQVLAIVIPTSNEVTVNVPGQVEEKSASQIPASPSTLLEPSIPTPTVPSAPVASLVPVVSTAPVVTPLEIADASNGSDYAPNGIIWCSALGHVPDVGQSCQLPEATTPPQQTTSVIYAPNTLSFTATPGPSNVTIDTSGNYVYAPSFASGTPTAGQVSLSVSGACSSDGTTVTFTGNNCSVTISQPGAAPITQVVQVLVASTEPRS